MNYDAGCVRCFYFYDKTAGDTRVIGFNNYLVACETWGCKEHEACRWRLESVHLLRAAWGTIWTQLTVAHTVTQPLFSVCLFLCATVVLPALLASQASLGGFSQVQYYMSQGLLSEHISASMLTPPAKGRRTPHSREGSKHRHIQRLENNIQMWHSTRIHKH